MRVAGGARWPTAARDQGGILIWWVGPPRVAEMTPPPLAQPRGRGSCPHPCLLLPHLSHHPPSGFCPKLPSTSGMGTVPLWGTRDRAALCQSLW